MLWVSLAVHWSLGLLSYKECCRAPGTCYLPLSICVEVPGKAGDCADSGTLNLGGCWGRIISFFLLVSFHALSNSFQCLGRLFSCLFLSPPVIKISGRVLLLWCGDQDRKPVTVLLRFILKNWFPWHQEWWIWKKKKRLFSKQVWGSPFYDWQLLSKFWWFYMNYFTVVIEVVMRNTYVCVVVGEGG